MPIYKDKPVLLDFGQEARKIDVTFLVGEPGKTVDQLYTDYIEPLQTLAGNGEKIEVQEAGRYNGYYAFKDFGVKEMGGVVTYFEVTMELWRVESTYV